MTFAGAVLVVVTCWLVGRALLPSRDVLERSWFEEQGVAYMLGVASILVTSMLWTGLGLSLTRVVVLAALGLGLAAATTCLLRRRRDEHGPLPAGLGRLGGTLVAAISVAGVAGTIALPLNEFDPIFHFAYKAKILFHDGVALGEAMTGIHGLFGRVQTHPGYPLGIPFLEAFAAHAGGQWSERWVQLPLAFWIPGLIAGVLLAVRSVSGSRGLAAAAVVVAATPMLIAPNPLEQIRRGDPGLTDAITLGGGADLALGAMLVGALALLVQARRTGSGRVAVLAGLLFAGTILIKNEGLALTALAFGSLVVASPARFWSRRRVYAIVMVATLLFSLPWLVHRSRLPSLDEDYGRILRVGNVVNRATTAESVPDSSGVGFTDESGRRRALRGPLAAVFFLTELGDVFSWGLLWPLFFFAVVFGGLAHHETRWLALLVLSGMALYLAVMIVSPWALYPLRSSGVPDRLLLHLVGPAAILIGIRSRPVRSAGDAGMTGSHTG